ncbi:hypothetical protein ACH3XW_46075 [Acanthocheilonema viteae]|uniref:Uncharacterized protein n=1 Tax=Acanthocheilonema viteae TaxID=6277 RepID=A0A498SFL9_ACAVI|nr:unnamed protein product [Acanthocheilonema viteae]
MSQEDDNREKSANTLDSIIDLLRFRLVRAVHNEVDLCGEMVARILDDTMPQDEGPLVTASYEDELMEDVSEGLSDQLGECDHKMDVATIATTEQYGEAMAEKDWENCSEDSPVPGEPELENVELERLNTPGSMESIVQEIFVKAVKIVIHMLENAGTDESVAYDDQVSYHDCL